MKLHDYTKLQSQNRVTVGSLIALW